MAKKKKRSMFKQLAHNHIENLSTGGNWNSFLRLEKQQNQLVSCYIDKIRITYCCDEDFNDTAWGGIMFVVSNSSTLDSTTPSNNNEKIVAAGASPGGFCSGVVTLDVKRSIKLNEEDSDSGMGQLWVFARSTDMSTTADVKIDTISEVWGRWHEIVSL